MQLQLTKWLNWVESFTENAIVAQPLKIFPTLYGNRLVITGTEEPVIDHFPELDESNLSPPM
jgi:hypothetical protein